MGIIGNRGLQGQPILPYADYKAYAGSDGFFDLQFVDHTQTPVIPTSFTYQLDDLTNSQNMIPATTPAVPSTSAYTLQIAGSLLVMTYPYQGSQICQLSCTFTALDSVTSASFTGKGVIIVELCSIQTPNGL